MSYILTLSNQFQLQRSVPGTKVLPKIGIQPLLVAEHVVQVQFSEMGVGMEQAKISGVDAHASRLHDEDPVSSSAQLINKLSRRCSSFVHQCQSYILL